MPADESTTDKITKDARRAFQHPFVTVTGPLGFGGLMLYMQLQSIDAGQVEVKRTQEDLRNQVTQLASKVDNMAEQASSRDSRLDTHAAEIAALKSRVAVIEASAELKRKR